MAVINAAANGFWADPGTWVGGVVPGVDDDVYANGKTVDITGSISVKSLNTTANGGAAGGTFAVLNSATITCSVGIFAGSSSCINVGNTSGLPITLTVHSPVFYGGTSGSNSRAINFASNATPSHLVIHGDIYGGSSTTNYGIRVATDGSFTLNGNVKSANGLYDPILMDRASTNTINGDWDLSAANIANNNNNGVDGNASLTINGDVRTGNLVNNQCSLLLSTSGPVVINGNVYGSNSVLGTPATSALRMNGTGLVTVNGNVYGGERPNSYGILMNVTTSQLVVNGVVYGGANNPLSPGVYITNASFIEVNGTLQAGQSPAVAEDSRTTGTSLRATGPFVSDPVSKAMPVKVERIQLIKQTAATNYFEVYDEEDNPVRFYTEDFGEDLPDKSDVRDGTIFGGAMEGTLAVPDPASVSVGVPTDDTVGTAVLSGPDIWNVPTEELVEEDTIGERLRNAATVSTTGAQIEAAFE